MDYLMAMIAIFGGNFAPQNWLLCNGALISISQNTALFSLIGTFYGGDGVQVFGLPDLQGRVPVGAGTSNVTGHTFNVGQTGGAETVTLNIGNLPTHTHTADLSTLVVSPQATTNAGTTNVPAAGLVPAALPVIGGGPSATSIKGYGAKTNTVSLGSGTVSGSLTIMPTGGNAAIDIMPPYQAMYYIICTAGVYPSRP